MNRTRSRTTDATAQRGGPPSPHHRTPQRRPHRPRLWWDTPELWDHPDNFVITNDTRPPVTTADIPPTDPNVQEHDQ